MKRKVQQLRKDVAGNRHLSSLTIFFYIFITEMKFRIYNNSPTASFCDMKNRNIN